MEIVRPGTFASRADASRVVSLRTVLETKYAMSTLVYAKRRAIVAIMTIVLMAISVSLAPVLKAVRTTMSVAERGCAAMMAPVLRAMPASMQRLIAMPVGHVLAAPAPLVAQVSPVQETKSVMCRRLRVLRLTIAVMTSIVWATEFVKTLCAKSRVKMMRPVSALESVEMMVAAPKGPIVTIMTIATVNVCALTLCVPMDARRTMSVRDSKHAERMVNVQQRLHVRLISIVWALTCVILERVVQPVQNKEPERDM